MIFRKFLEPVLNGEDELVPMLAWSQIAAVELDPPRVVIEYVLEVPPGGDLVSTLLRQVSSNVGESTKRLRLRSIVGFYFELPILGPDASAISWGRGEIVLEVMRGHHGEVHSHL